MTTMTPKMLKEGDTLATSLRKMAKILSDNKICENLGGVNGGPLWILRRLIQGWYHIVSVERVQ